MKQLFKKTLSDCTAATCGAGPGTQFSPCWPQVSPAPLHLPSHSALSLAPGPVLNVGTRYRTKRIKLCDFTKLPFSGRKQ